MRLRKPWVRARRTLLGWYVRFMIQGSDNWRKNGSAGYAPCGSGVNTCSAE
jgi:hypothetical protein